jgi:hypothetical protein
VAAQAQIEFGPIPLDSNEQCFNSHLFRNAPDELLCVWGAGSDTLMPGFGQRFTMDGITVGSVRRYDTAVLRHFGCPASVTVIPLTGGREARLLVHS